MRVGDQRQPFGVAAWRRSSRISAFFISNLRVRRGWWLNMLAGDIRPDVGIEQEELAVLGEAVAVFRRLAWPSRTDF
jgi:hypothetical protein